MQEMSIAPLSSFLPFWDALTPAQQQKLTQFSSLRRFAKQEVLHRGSEDCNGVYLIVSGQLRTFIVSDGGKEITLFRLFDWDVCLLSASCLFNNITFDVNVQAEKDTTAYIIPSKVFNELMKESLPVLEYANQLMASSFSEVMWVMEQVLFSRFDQRLAAFLLEQSNIENSLTLHITQEEIARHLGSAREVVSRMIKYFQSESMLTTFRGGLTLLAPKKLSQWAVKSS